MKNEKTVKLKQVEVKIITAKAVLLDVKGKEIWFPFSQIETSKSKIKKEKVMDIIITEWIAEKKGLI